MSVDLDAVRELLQSGPVTKTRVVNLHHHAFDVYIGRAGKGFEGLFGNPCRAGAVCPECSERHADGDSTLLCFERYFLRRVEHDTLFREAVLSLRGKTLGCFCFPRPCHGNVIANFVDSQ